MNSHQILTKKLNNLTEEIDTVLLKRIRELPQNTWDSLTREQQNEIHKFSTLEFKRHEVTVYDKLRMLWNVIDAGK